VEAGLPESATAVTQPLPPPQSHDDPDRIAIHPAHAPSFMARAVLRANEQIEHIGEVAVVVLEGAMLWAVDWSLVPWWLVPVLFLVVRPVSVAIGLAGSSADTVVHGISVTPLMDLYKKNRR